MNEPMHDVVHSTEPYAEENDVPDQLSSDEEENDENASDVVKAINAASQLLKSINGSAPQSPARRSTASSSRPSSTSEPRASKSIANSSSASPALKFNGQTLSEAQIDAFLLIANCGKPIGGEKTNSVPGQADDAIIATVQSVIDQLMAQNKHLIASGSETAPSGLTRSVQIGQISDDRAAALKKVLSMNALACNTIIPVAQARATSRFYRELARALPPSGGINPARASAYGSTARLHERVIADPRVYTGPYPMLPQHPSPPMLSASRQRELERVQIYGFPPQAGARLGPRDVRP